MARSGWVLAVLASCLGVAPLAADRLEVHPTNPRWLTEDGGKTAIVLTGAHTWSSFQDYARDEPFKATAYFKGLAGDGHNFTRGWFFEDGYYSPLPWARDGGLYRLSAPFRKAYLKRVKQRLRSARRRGLYASVMLFQGWSVSSQRGRRVPGPWPRHPFNRVNTAESVTRQGEALHFGPAQRQQLDYVGFLAKRLCSQPNLIWEIANEPDPRSLAREGGVIWQRQILARIESECSKRLTWISCPTTAGLSVDETEALNDVLPTLGADLISPCDPRGRAIADPAFGNGTGVMIADSDHLGEVDFTWAWRAWLRGQHPVFMDLSQPLDWWNGSSWDEDDSAWPRVRRALGAIQEMAALVNRTRTDRVASGLAAMAPQDNAGGAPGETVRPTSARWALFSSDQPCPQSRGVCILAEANGNEVVAYAQPSETVQACSLRPLAEYDGRWKKARGRGFHGPTQVHETDSEGCLRLANPANSVAILHLERLTG